MDRSQVSLKITQGTPVNYKPWIALAIILAVVFGILYFVFAWILPFIGKLVLVGLAAFGCVILFAKKPQIDRTKPWIQVATEKVRVEKKNPRLTEKYALEKDVGDRVIVMLIWVALIIVVACYATDKAYQVMPLNFLGFATVLVMVVQAVQALQIALWLQNNQDKPYPTPSLFRKVVIYTCAALVLVYPIGVFAVSFGVF